MLLLSIQVVGNNQKDNERFCKMVREVERNFVTDKIAQIKNSQSKERITIEQGINHFAVFGWQTK